MNGPMNGNDGTTSPDLRTGSSLGSPQLQGFAASRAGCDPQAPFPRESSSFTADNICS